MKPLKLNLGAGSWTLDGWKSIDIKNGGFDIRHNWPVEDGSVGEILASHVLEHLTRSEAFLFLSKCNRALIAGGELHIATPDLDKFIDCRIRGDFTPLGGYPWIDLNHLLGGNEIDDTEFEPADKHLYAWSWAALAYTLETIGFVNIHRRFHPAEFDNPLYKNISLYVDARTADNAR